jgi:hypothetical protein
MLVCLKQQRNSTLVHESRTEFALLLDQCLPDKDVSKMDNTQEWPDRFNCNTVVL